jgi:hypothetical protein
MHFEVFIYLWPGKRNVTSHAVTITSPTTMSDGRLNVKVRVCQDKRVPLLGQEGWLRHQ